MDDADQELTAWSRSLEIFLRDVPQTQVVTSIVSHVLDPVYMHHPLTWLRRGRPDRQRLAMMIQIIQQMLGKRLQIVPHVSFGDRNRGPRAAPRTRPTLDTIVASAERLLKSHLAWQT